LTASCHLTAWIHLCTFARRSRRFGRTKNGKNTQRNDSVVGKRGTGCMGHRRGPQGFHSTHNCNVELISPTGDTLDPGGGRLKTETLECLLDWPDLLYLRFSYFFDHFPPLHY
jgi:hypothetical protein